MTGQQPQDPQDPQPHDGGPRDEGLREQWIELPGGSSLGDVEPVAVGPGDPSAAQHRSQPAQTDRQADAADGDASLLALVDRLTEMLEKNDLGRLEVSAGSTTIVLRSAASLERTVAVAPVAPVAIEHIGHDPHAATHAPGAGAGAAAAAPVPAAAPVAAKPSVKAPLTGIYYGAPSPGATPYVKVGDHVSVGQIIGLIEAMKLFNEIKSDLAGRVVKICADNGALVKAKSPLIEVEPA